MKIAAATTIAVLALLAAGCGGSKHAAQAPSTQAPTTATKPSASTPTETTAAPTAGATNTCLDVPTSLARALKKHLALTGGRISHLRAVRTKTFPDLYFVSARIDGGGTKALLATWASKGLGGRGPVYAVDAAAALISVYGAAVGKDRDLTVDAPGVYKSRVCVAGPGAPRGSTAPVGTGGGGPAIK